METKKYLLLIFVWGLFFACGESQKDDLLSSGTRSASILPEANKISADEIPTILYPEIEVTMWDSEQSTADKPEASTAMDRLYDYPTMDTVQVAWQQKNMESNRAIKLGFLWTLPPKNSLTL